MIQTKLAKKFHPVKNKFDAPGGLIPGGPAAARPARNRGKNRGKSGKIGKIQDSRILASRRANWL
jgi:hypothetical protein